MKITQAEIKYYGTLAATLFVLFLSTEHISEALKVVERNASTESTIFSGTWLAAAGLQVFEVLTAIGIADLISRRNRSSSVLKMLISILAFFFLINLFGNILYAVSNMVDITGRELLFDNIKKMDWLQIFWVLWAAIPIPLMGLAGVTVQAIFKKDLPRKKSDVKKLVSTHSPDTPVQDTPTQDDAEKQPQPGDGFRPY